MHLRCRKPCHPLLLMALSEAASLLEGMLQHVGDD